MFLIPSLLKLIICIRSVETGHLDGVFMHKKAQKLKFLCERNDKVRLEQNWTGFEIFISRYSSPAPRVGPRAKSTSWRSTNLGWPTGSTSQDWKVQYLRACGLKVTLLCCCLEYGHLLFCPRISFKGLGSILGPGDLWPLVNYCDGWAQSRCPKTRHAKCVGEFWAENIVLRSILSLIFLLALSPGIQTYLRRVVSLHTPWEGGRWRNYWRCNFVGSNICKILIIFHFCIFYLQMSHCPRLPN